MSVMVGRSQRKASAKAAKYRLENPWERFHDGMIGLNHYGNMMMNSHSMRDSPFAGIQTNGTVSGELLFKMTCC
jgi:hypothetical protein